MSSGRLQVLTALPSAKDLCVSMEKRLGVPQSRSAVCLSVRPSVYLSVRRSVGPSVGASIGPSSRRSVRPSVRPSVCLCLCPSIRRSVCQPSYISVFISIHPTIHLSNLYFYLSVPASVRPLSVYPSVLHKYVCPSSICMFVCSSIHPSVRLFAFFSSCHYVIAICLELSFIIPFKSEGSSVCNAACFSIFPVTSRL